MSRLSTGAWVASALIGVLVVSGCRAKTDLGRPCTLVKKDPSDAAKSVPLKESEISSGKDFISFGATECEELVCVRDADVKAGKPTDEAVGYCSSACIPGSSVKCLNENPADDKDAAKKLKCRTLLLDEATLASLRTADPEAYKRYFGETTKPYFCARGGE